MTEPAHKVSFGKVAFASESDVNGNKPVIVETLRAAQFGQDIYRLEHIPFYACGVSPLDIVRTEPKFGMNVFREIIRSSGVSVFRIYVSDRSDVADAMTEFSKLFCESVLSDSTKMLALGIPENVDFGPAANLLIDGLEGGRWGYEEACLRHKPTDRYIQKSKELNDIQERKCL